MCRLLPVVRCGVAKESGGRVARRGGPTRDGVAVLVSGDDCGVHASYTAVNEGDSAGAASTRGNSRSADRRELIVCWELSPNRVLCSERGEARRGCDVSNFRAGLPSRGGREGCRRYSICSRVNMLGQRANDPVGGEDGA